MVQLPYSAKTKTVIIPRRTQHNDIGRQPLIKNESYPRFLTLSELISGENHGLQIGDIKN